MAEQVNSIDIIIPTYNRAWSLNRAIESVVSQVDEQWLLWIVDDGSTDNTVDLVRSWQKQDFRVQYLFQNRQGVSAARNYGIRNSSGSFIAFLDSDDQWQPEKLKMQRKFFEKSSNCPLVHTEEIWVRRGVRVNPMKKHKKQGGDIFLNCLPLCCISPSSVMLRRSVFQEVGLFREDFPVCEDYDLWLKICSRHQVGFINENLVIKQGGHPDQLSTQYVAMDYYRVLSMDSLLKQKCLNGEKQVATEAMLRKKAQLLLRGYRKHQNLSRYDSIFSILQKLN